MAANVEADEEEEVEEQRDSGDDYGSYTDADSDGGSESEEGAVGNLQPFDVSQLLQQRRSLKAPPGQR